MICKKCGANIAEMSKFCGYCGNKVEDNAVQTQNIPNLQNNYAVNSGQNINNNEARSEIAVNTNMGGGISSLNDDNQQVVMQNPIDNSLNNQQPNDIYTNNSLNSNIDINTVQDTNNNLNDVQTNVVSNNNSQEPKNKKGVGAKKWLIIILGIVLAGIVILLLFVALNKSAKTSIKPLETAIGNLKNVNSGTFKIGVSVEGEEFGNINLNGVLKFSRENKNSSFEFNLNKSLFFDDITLYSTADEDELKLYVDSNTVDLLGKTKSKDKLWLNYVVDLSDIITDDIKDDIKDDDLDIDLSEMLEDLHLQFVGKSNGLNHYKIVVDYSLMQTMERNLLEYNDTLDDLPTTSADGNSYAIDLYLNDSDELVKVSVDLSQGISIDGISKAVLTIEFSDLNATVVTIPNEAKKSSVDIVTYFEKYSVDETDTDEDSINSKNLQ